MSEANLRAMFARADSDDLAEGLLAYERYHELMIRISERYKISPPRTVAGFVSLSPNSDYVGNLRSLISVCEGIRDGRPSSDITVSTYKHCRDRAYLYLTGQADFVRRTTGPKVLNFYHNLLSPRDHRWVTIDGHMVAAWRGLPLTMKEAIIRRKSEYGEIADAVKRLAFDQFMVPCQYQATIWFTRKRVLGVKYDPQRDIFYQGDVWKTFQNLDDIKPYPRTRPTLRPKGSSRRVGARVRAGRLFD